MKPSEPQTSSMKSRGGPARILNAFRYSLQGLGHALRHEAAFRQELLIVVPALVGLWFLPVSRAEQAILLISSLLVLIVELLNSAVEATVDRISTERHPLAGRAKDLGSAAVLLAVLQMLACWALIAGPLLLQAR
ncbi:diacylglycerol kinase [Viridibacterium curvum]|uniref:Diacylglycerol kinase n=1 Tax=Viridibacterium curvum TaxID=1101404 RepID=A0ABP9QVG3_9RHOO